MKGRAIVCSGGTEGEEVLGYGWLVEFGIVCKLGRRCSYFSGLRYSFAEDFDLDITDAGVEGDRHDS